MNAWPDTDGSAIARYLRQLQPHDPGTCRVYRCILSAFQRFVAQHPYSPPVSRASLEAWLRERAAQWPIHLVLHRARIVDRFLDFLVLDGSITSNPIAALRAQYGLRWSQPIVRALLAADPDQVLETLRPLPPFASVLGDVMRCHIERMRALGHRYDTQARSFLRFDRFLQRHPDLAEAPLARMLQRWAATSSSLIHAVECERLGRALAKARRHIDPTVVLPRADRRLRQRAAQEWRQPYIFTPDEVRLLLDTARAYPSPRAPLRPLSLYTMLVLAYCAGLRLGEISHLDLRDIDLRADEITIRESKFFKSRILPLTGSVVAALRAYLDARRCAGAPQDGSSGLFWHGQEPGKRYAYVTIEQALVKVLRRAGLKREQGRKGPRLHDLRHSMVVNRMLDWYRAGINPQGRLPYLATYLGHRDIHSTLVYLTITQDLLQQAGERFRAYGAHCLGVTEGAQP